MFLTTKNLYAFILKSLKEDPEAVESMKQLDYIIQDVNIETVLADESTFEMHIDPYGSEGVYAEAYYIPGIDCGNCKPEGIHLFTAKTLVEGKEGYRLMGNLIALAQYYADRYLTSNWECTVSAERADYVKKNYIEKGISKDALVQDFYDMRSTSKSKFGYRSIELLKQDIDHYDLAEQFLLELKGACEDRKGGMVDLKLVLNPYVYAQNSIEDLHRDLHRKVIEEICMSICNCGDCSYCITEMADGTVKTSPCLYANMLSKLEAVIIDKKSFCMPYHRDENGELRKIAQKYAYEMTKSEDGYSLYFMKKVVVKGKSYRQARTNGSIPNVLSSKQIKEYFSQRALYFERPDGSTSMVQDNGYSLEKCLKLYDMGFKFFVD